MRDAKHICILSGEARKTKKKIKLKKKHANKSKTYEIILNIRWIDRRVIQT